MEKQTPIFDYCALNAVLFSLLTFVANLEAYRKIGPPFPPW